MEKDDLNNPCGKISWQSIVWPGPGLAMSRQVSLDVLVWVRSWRWSTFHDKKACIPCRKISWQSIVWYGPDLAMSRPARLEVLVWLRSGLRLSNLWLVASQPLTNDWSYKNVTVLASPRPDLIVSDITGN